jgi:hypothetical protein
MCALLTPVVRAPGSAAARDAASELLRALRANIFGRVWMNERKEREGRVAVSGGPLGTRAHGGSRVDQS